MVLNFVGTKLDSQRMSARLPDDKLARLQQLLLDCVTERFAQKGTATACCHGDPFRPLFSPENDWPLSFST